MDQIQFIVSYWMISETPDSLEHFSLFLVVSDLAIHAQFENWPCIVVDFDTTFKNVSIFIL